MNKIYAVLALVLAIPVFTMAQEIVLTPQIGIQSSNTKTSYNNSPYYTPARSVTGFAGFRLNYQSKKGHGPYIGFGLGTSTTSYNIVDPGTPANPGNLLGSNASTDVFRIQTGYQWNSRPIYLKRLWDNHTSYEEFSQLQNKGWSVRIQPYIGLGIDLRNGNASTYAFQSSSGTIVNYYSKKSPNINTGINFEFGANGKKKFTLGFNLVHGLGTMQSTTISKTYNGNNYETWLYNRSSGYNITFGVPLTLWKVK